MEETKKPILDKLFEVKAKSQAIGEFLEWMFYSKKYHIVRYLTEEEYVSKDNIEWRDSMYEQKRFKHHIIAEDEVIPVQINIEKLLAEYFEIDLQKVEEERREILKNIKEI